MTEKEDTKLCPYCSEPIKAAAIVCKHCGQDLTVPEQEDPEPSLTAPTAAPEREARRSSGIGFVGMIILAAGFCSIPVYDSYLFPIVLIIVGAGILIYALVSGNLPFMSR